LRFDECLNGVSVFLVRFAILFLELNQQFHAGVKQLGNGAQALLDLAGAILKAHGHIVTCGRAPAGAPHGLDSSLALAPTGR
jgi:hypothetical protein